jgi:hypothetical protein
LPQKSSTGLSTTTGFWIRKLSFSLLIVTCWASPSWAKIESAEIVDNPIVNGDRVTIRVKAKQTDGKPVLSLQEDNFQLLVNSQPIKFKSKDWKSSKEATPPPVWIVFLLDYSGSMNGKDSKGTTKVAGAIDGIKQFTQAAAKRGGDTKVSIVLFSEDKDNSDCNYPVTAKEIDNFLPVDDIKVTKGLESLQAKKPCRTTSTNIYDPVAETVKFLNNSKDPRFKVDESSGIRPRLVTVLLSDGYHEVGNEQTEFDRLIGFLQKNDSVTIHTLGYGLTQKELGSRKGMNRPAQRTDVGKSVTSLEFVDEERLAAIANTTGGISEFSPDAKTLSEKLDIFLNAILGEYEISYVEPNPERGSKRNVQVVLKTASEEVRSPEKSYVISVFGRPVSLSKRLIMISGLGLFLLIGGVLPFWWWGKELKKGAL